MDVESLEVQGISIFQHSELKERMVDRCFEERAMQ